MIPPLTEAERENLERSLRSEGCREALVVWGDVIVDGHNRYEICRKWGIPFRVIRLNFTSRAAAISWICLNQLSRRNLTPEAYRYLIGKQYDAEKAQGYNRNPEGRNQYGEPGTGKAEAGESGRKVSFRLAKAYHLCHTTVERYGDLSRALDRIEEKKPGTLPSFLSGRCRLPRQRLEALSRLPEEKLGPALDRLMNEPAPASGRGGARRGGKKKSSLDTKVKEMPKFNPDGDINAAAYTVPSWCETLARLTRSGARYASPEARRRLSDALGRLVLVAADLRSELEERT